MTFSQHGSMVTPTISNARSRGREDRGAADKSSAFAPAQEAGARERGCRRSGNGSCAVCRWFVGEHPPDCHNVERYRTVKRGTCFPAHVSAMISTGIITFFILFQFSITDQSYSSFLMPIQSIYLLDQP